ncbi:MAG: C25 family cysteine peptidase, partial [Cyclobacteriaceae bacterium]|nr:C25 family cysteine peptidase [Cyclobacteriaceae bacterium]
MKFGIKMLAFGLFLLSFSASGQYANSWISRNQSYYKISVSKDGIYKLTYSDLLAASFPVNSVNPRLIKLYHRGVEQAIFIQGESDAVFNTTDFIEFFGRKNDGTRDQKLYQPPSAQPHNLYNLYSDTTAYFLTYSLIPPGGKRMANFSEVNISGIPKENFHNEERLLVLGNSYSAGATQNSELSNTQFVQAEGWFGTALQQNQSIDYVLDLVVNSMPVAGQPLLEVLLVGRSNIPHNGEVWVGPNTGSLRSLTVANFFGFETPLLSLPLNWSDVGSDGRMTIRLKAGTATTNRFQFSTAYVKITFPQHFNASSTTEKKFILQANGANKSYIEIDNPSATMRMWDVTNPNEVITIGTRAAGSTLSAVVSNTSTPRKLFAASITTTPPIKSVSFRSINPTIPNFLIITNRALLKPALGYANVVRSYAEYRASAVGGKYDTLTITVDQLYDQFNYGETSSLAIYEFMRWMVDKGNPKYLFIIGKGRDISSYSSYQRKTLPANEFRDLVPSAGYPAADMAFTAGLGDTSFEPK